MACTNAEGPETCSGNLPVLLVLHLLAPFIHPSCIHSLTPSLIHPSLPSSIHPSMCSDTDGPPSPKPERSAMSSMGFTRSQPSQSRLPSFSGLRSKASSSSAHAQAPPQRSGPSFGKKGHSVFTREATPVSPSLHASVSTCCLTAPVQARLHCWGDFRLHVLCLGVCSLLQIDGG